MEAVVGRGGMGVVYRATQLSLERPVALKAIAPELAGDATFRERFKRESRIAASIEHPNVIPVYEAGEGEGLLYLIMRYVEGTDLRALIDAEGGLSPERATRIVAQVAAALAAAHRRDLIHRDVKPANVLIDAGGERDHAYLTDFGIARHAAATSGLTRTGSVIGTLDYLAPERIQDQGGDGRSDVYALGCVLYEALTGTLPFERDNDVAKMYAHLSAPAPSARAVKPEVPEDVDALALRAMAKDPDDRFETAGEMAEALTDTLPARPRSALEARKTPLPAAPAEPAEATPAEAPPGDAPPGVSEEAALAAETAEELSPAERRAERAEAETAAAAPPGTAAPETAPPAAAPPGTAPPATAPPAAAPPPRGRSGLLAALAGVFALAAVVAVFVLSGGDDPGDDPAPRDGPVAGAGSPEPEEPPPLDPRVLRGRVISLPPGADGAAAGGGFVWIANRSTDQVFRVDARTRDVMPISVGDEPDSVAIQPGRAVWVTNTAADTVSRIDLASGDPSGSPVSVGNAPEGIAVGHGAVWVANGAAGTVSRIDLATGDRIDTPVGESPVQVAIADDEVWVTVSGEDRVVSLDRDSGDVVRSDVVVKGTPRGIAFDGERVWVSATNAGRVVHFDPANPDDRGKVPVPDGPREVRFGEGGIWVASSASGRVTAIDPASRRRRGSVEVQPVNYALAVADGLVWTASEDTGSVFPIEPRPEG